MHKPPRKTSFTIPPETAVDAAATVSLRGAPTRNSILPKMNQMRSNPLPKGETLRSAGQSSLKAGQPDAVGLKQLSRGSSQSMQQRGNVEQMKSSVQKGDATGSQMIGNGSINRTLQKPLPSRAILTNKREPLQQYIVPSNTQRARGSSLSKTSTSKEDNEYANLAQNKYTNPLALNRVEDQKQDEKSFVQTGIKRGEPTRVENRIQQRKEAARVASRDRCLLNRVSQHINHIILLFCASSYQQVFILSLVSRGFRSTINQSFVIWHSLLRRFPKSHSLYQAEVSKICINCCEIATTSEANEKDISRMRGLIEAAEKDKVLKVYEAFFVDYRKQFEYCSTKENKMNKLIGRLCLSVSASINDGKVKIPSKKFQMRCDNFASHLLIRFDEVNQIDLLYLDRLKMSITFRSTLLNTSVKIERSFKVSEMLDRSIARKAFSYFEDRNFLTAFFEGDGRFLYTLFEISAVELVSRFRFELQERLVYKDAKRQQKVANKQVAKWLGRDLSSAKYEDFGEYLRFQSDFEVIMNVHNSEKMNLYSFVDTRSYPKESSQAAAVFRFTLRERFFSENVFALNNKQGMKERVEDLLLMDLILKDRDRFLICFSGFVRICEMSSSEKSQIDRNMEFSDADEYQAKRIQFKQEGIYHFQLIVIQTRHESILEMIEITLFPKAIALNLP